MRRCDSCSQFAAIERERAADDKRSDERRILILIVHRRNAWPSRGARRRGPRVGSELVGHCGGSAAEWLACWTQAQKAPVQIAAVTLSGSSLKQTVHTHCASVHQAAKLVAALLRVAGVTAGLAESNGSLPPGL